MSLSYRTPNEHENPIIPRATFLGNLYVIASDNYCVCAVLHYFPTHLLKLKVILTQNSWGPLLSSQDLLTFVHCFIQEIKIDEPYRNTFCTTRVYINPPPVQQQQHQQQQQCHQGRSFRILSPYYDTWISVWRLRSYYHTASSFTAKDSSLELNKHLPGSVLLAGALPPYLD